MNAEHRHLRDLCSAYYEAINSKDQNLVIDLWIEWCKIWNTTEVPRNTLYEPPKQFYRIKRKVVVEEIQEVQKSIFGFSVNPDDNNKCFLCKSLGHTCDYHRSYQTS